MRPVFPLIMLSTLTLSGCLQPDALMSEDASSARREIRLQSYQHFSCDQLRLHRAGNLPSRSAIGYLSVVGGHGRQELADIEEMMRRKGCKRRA